MKNIIKILIISVFISFAFAGDKTSFFSKNAISKFQKLYGSRAKKRLIALDNLMQEIKNNSEENKIQKVNNFFNQLQFLDDIKVWQQSDYWASRIEFLGKGAGDCEDFVIAKYFTLKQLGVSTKKLYFTYVRAKQYNQAHMVLAYYENKKSIPLILDNINPKILQATKRKDLIPVYSFNGDSLFLAKQTGLGKIVPSGNSKNKKWLNFLEKIKKGEI